MNKAKERNIQPSIPYRYKDPKALVEERMLEIKVSLREHYSHLEQLYAFASGQKKLSAARFQKQIQKFSLGQNHERRLQWTVENIQRQILSLQAELFDLIGRLP